MPVARKRDVLKLAGLSVLLLSAALIGCSKKEEAAPAAAPAKPDALKVAFAYVGPVGDGGWTFAHDNARKAIEKEFGDKVVTSFVEKVSEAADAEPVVCERCGRPVRVRRLVVEYLDVAEVLDES